MAAVTVRAPDRISEPWGARMPYGAGASWPERVDVHLDDGVSEGDVEAWVPSASVLSSNGDAMDIAVAGGRIVGVRGRAGDRVNRGRLGPKDLFAWRAMASPDRLTRPLVRRGGKLVPATWDEAMGLVVERSRALLYEPGGWGRFGFYTSGQLFLEEYYTLAVIGKAGIGTPHMDGNTRLCTATAAAALKASFGTDGGQPLGQLGHPGAAAHVDAHGQALRRGVAAGHALDEAGQQFGRQVVDAVVAQVLEGVERDRLARAGHAADDDEGGGVGNVQVGPVVIRRVRGNGCGGP